MQLLPTIVRSALVLASVSALGCTRGYEPANPPPPATTHAAPAVAAPGPVDPNAALPPGHPAMGAPSPDAVPGPAPTGAPLAGGLTWTAAAPLVAHALPAGSMRAAEYGVVGAGGAGEAVLAVFHFGAGAGGSVQDNVDRWAGQFTGPGGAPAVPVIAHRTVGALAVTTVEANGSMAAAMAGAPEAAPAAASKLLGAIIEGPGGMVFFKLTGQSATVESARVAFDALLASLTPASPAAAAPAAAAPVAP